VLLGCSVGMIRRGSTLGGMEYQAASYLKDVIGIELWHRRGRHSQARAVPPRLLGLEVLGVLRAGDWDTTVKSGNKLPAMPLQLFGPHPLSCLCYNPVRPSRSHGVAEKETKGSPRSCTHQVDSPEKKDTPKLREPLLLCITKITATQHESESLMVWNSCPLRARCSRASSFLAARRYMHSQ
jgi:hypothetical protein